MNHVERFRAVMNFQPVDRLPHVEWATWWDQTIDKWKAQGLPAHLNDVFEITAYLGLDPYKQFWISASQAGTDAEQHDVCGTVSHMDDYLRIRKNIFPSHERDLAAMEKWARLQSQGDVVVWITFEGFFWFPRTLLGIERHMYTFFDNPELMHAMNQDLADYLKRILQSLSGHCIPTFITFAEDMSYNHGPMLSKEMFETFLLPYYKQLMPLINELNIIPIVDTDGDVSQMVPWLLDAGLLGVLPLERQAGVDGSTLRADFPNLRMIGHYDKMVMHLGEADIRKEFQRLVPLMKTGGFIPSVDHQTPPAVSLSQYQTYLKLLSEYAQPCSW